MTTKRQCGAQRLGKAHITGEAVSSPEHTSERLPQSRSINNIPSQLLAVVHKASEAIVHRTLFENPFPASTELSEWISDTWQEALNSRSQSFEECSAVYRREVQYTRVSEPSDWL